MADADPYRQFAANMLHPYPPAGIPAGPRMGLLIAAMAAVLAGCGLAPAYEGTEARPDNRLSLETAGGEGAVWRTRDVAIYYAAAREGDVFRIDGRVERLNPIEHFPLIDRFRVALHFIDAAGTVIESQLLWSAGAGADARLMRWTFSQRYPLPPGAAAFGFSYRGTFSESGDDDGGQSDWEVWQRP